MTKRRASCLALTALAWASMAQGFSGGIATTSFPVAAQGCNFCHAGGSAPTVTLECVDCIGLAVAPLSVHELKLTVFEIGLQDHAGLNVSSVLGTLSTGGGAAANTKTIAGTGGRDEITHTAPKAASGGMTEFTFLWTAPASPTSATLEAWGNAVNANGTTAGDAASKTTLNLIVGNTPTPTETPTLDPNGTPTPTPTFVSGCPSTTDPGCVTGFEKGLLLVKAVVPGRERLIAKLLRGPALTQTDLGNPLDAGQGGTGTVFSLCVYDGAANLAGAVRVDRAGDTCDGVPCWLPIGRAPNDPRGPGSGYRYRDRSLNSDGTRRIVYRGGNPGRSKAILVGKGSNLPMGIPAALQSSSQVTVQLRSSDGVCLSMNLADIRKQESDYFRARGSAP